MNASELAICSAVSQWVPRNINNCRPTEFRGVFQPNGSELRCP